MIHPYSSESYVRALAGEQEVVYLESLGAWVIVRSIPSSSYRDAIGPYPFTPTKSRIAATELRQSLNENELISLVFVTDALSGSSESEYPGFDLVMPYKEHYVLERGTPLRLTKHHRYEVRKGNAHCEVREIRLVDFLDQWCTLYKYLIDRHSLRGLHQFSRDYFETIANMSDFITIAAFVEQELVSCHIWLRTNDYVYSHLAASNERGYQTSAAYAVNAYAVGLFEECRLLDFGGVADTEKSSEGLARFKKGFVNSARVNRLCGVVADQDRYRELCRSVEQGQRYSDYFPAYRRGQACPKDI